MAGLVNYPIVSLFQQVDVLFDGNLISSSVNIYAYRAMLEVLLGYNERTKNSYITVGLYSKDTTTKMDLVAVDGASGGLKARTQYIKESKMVEVAGLLHYDLVSSNRLLLNSLPLNIVLHRQSSNILTHLKLVSIRIEKCLAHHSSSILLIIIST